uniref:Choloylglycine hydrolase/NAAA C-terminal domain-containing protein n=1 Tax=Oxyrrhis marina TaxID=2969 RepID=A0A7S4GP42_OXYMA|mmetsp:Transcript_35922/g.86477  ORF Transcript_35922/g.86477 Transcript_35922/m.86477 type:complete len:358 (+) Transcript_35922:47-1120(+)
MRITSATIVALVGGCSYFEVPYGDKATDFVIGRTMELGNIAGVMEYTADVEPRTTSHHGMVALNMRSPLLPGIALTVEGMNEVGLTISGQTLRQSEYQKKEAGKLDIDALSVTREVLRRCDSVDDAVKFLGNVSVTPPPAIGSPDGNGIHWALHDPTGRSIVIEYLKGEMVVYNNTPRVMTNDPDLHWHWRNLDTYVNLNPSFPHQNDFLAVDTEVGSVPSAVGHGWNLFGLPGDSSPPSRFVRMFYLRGYALKHTKVNTTSDAMALSTVMLNNLMFPTGSVAKDPKVLTDPYETVPYAVIKVPSEKLVVFRGYRNTQWRQIDLKKVNFNVAKQWPVEDGSLGIRELIQEDESTPVV